MLCYRVHYIYNLCHTRCVCLPNFRDKREEWKGEDRGGMRCCIEKSVAANDTHLWMKCIRRLSFPPGLAESFLTKSVSGIYLYSVWERIKIK